MLFRGAVFLMAANLVYVVVAYAIQTGMGRMLGRLLPDSPMLLVPGYIAIGIAYLGVLFLLRELRGEDVAFVLRALGLRREQPAAASPGEVNQ